MEELAKLLLYYIDHELGYNFDEWLTWVDLSDDDDVEKKIWDDFKKISSEMQNFKVEMRE